MISYTDTLILLNYPSWQEFLLVSLQAYDPSTSMLCNFSEPATNGVSSNVLNKMHYTRCVGLSNLKLTNFNSTLDQFEITKFPLSGKDGIVYKVSYFVFGKKVIVNLSEFLEKLLIKFICYIHLFGIKFTFLKKLLIKIYLEIRGLFFLNTSSTKNYMFSRIMNLCSRTILKLYIRKKILLMTRFNAQVIKERIHVEFKNIIISNFGHKFPYYNRLLNYLPYLFYIFISIVLYNYNGLLFYGFCNTAFLFQNIVISFQIVVGLTLIEFLLDLLHFIKCLFLREYLYYYYHF